MTEIPKEEYVLKCTSACAGCPSSLILRYVLKAAGPDTVLVVPACCTSVIQGSYPNTALNVPVYNIAFASAAACASGMSEAFQKAGEKTNVIVYAGDGGTVDIGIQALSGAFERETEFLYICYDNEAYGNTGMQRSGSTPVGARTTTTPGGKIHAKKDLDAIVAAHNPSYLATACAAYPQDLFKKVGKALSLRGSKFIHVLAPCPPGWRFSSANRRHHEAGNGDSESYGWYRTFFSDTRQFDPGRHGPNHGMRFRVAGTLGSTPEKRQKQRSDFSGIS